MLAEIGARPLIEARDYIATHKRAAAKVIEKAAAELPVWASFVEGVRGVGKQALGQIIAETGDLARYDNPAKLWKRMGLAVGTDGRAQRRIKAQADIKTGRTKDDSRDEAILQGYSPRRRSLMHVVGECLIKQNGEGPYRTLYNERKAYEQAKAPELTPLQHHRRAMRYMEKRFLLHLWQAWRREAIVDSTPIVAVPHDVALVA
jgi:hypothetical protein